MAEEEAIGNSRYLNKEKGEERWHRYKTKNKCDPLGSALCPSFLKGEFYEWEAEFFRKLGTLFVYCLFVLAITCVLVFPLLSCCSFFSMKKPSVNKLILH